MGSILLLKNFVSVHFRTQLVVFILLLSSVGVWGQISENFNSISGTGGNDGLWSGSAAGSAQSSPWNSWTLTSAYSGDKCLRLGNGSAKGIAQTPTLGISGSGTLTFKAGAWDGGSEQTDLVLSITGTGSSLSSTTVTMIKGGFTSYSIDIIGSTVDSKISFAGKNASNSRFFLDDVVITATTSCTPPADPIGLITASANPSCGPATLSFASGYYWQTSVSGTSTVYPTSATYSQGTTGTVYVRAYDGTSCWSINTVSSGLVTINSPVTISTQPASKSVVAGGTTSFSVTASNVASYQWQVNTGSGFTNLTNAGPYSTVTTSTLNIANATLGMTGYLYRCVLMGIAPCSSTATDGLSALTITNASPNNATALKACIANNQISLSWTASSGTAPTGYIVYALPNTAVPQMAAASAGNASGYTVNSSYAAATSYTTLGKAVYKGNSTSATVTGLTNSLQYTFKVVAYNGETGTGWAAGINTSGSWNQGYVVDVPEITSLSASISTTTSTVSWNVVPNSAGCYEYMVVANSGAVTLTPSGDGSSYAANPAYSSSNQVVYKGSGNSIIVTGLTDGVNYCYKVFVRELNSENQWSGGTSVCATPTINYCTSTGATNSSMIKNVVFNTINQTSNSTGGYSDYTAVTTQVYLGSTHDLSVKVNTNGNYTSYVKAWIDWNKNGSFESNEGYELGTATNTTDGSPSASVFSITVPTNASLGNVRMRIAANTDTGVNGYSTPCQNFTYGEVEDYTLTITQSLNAEINIKGGSISIANGFDSPYSLNNTLFASTALGIDSIEKEFTLENIGLANLNLTGTPIIKIEGAHATDFIVTQQAATPVVNGVNTTFKIKFNPTVAGTRSATVRIENNDSDENPYLFALQGMGVCTVEPTITVFPLSGPSGTLVTITSATNNLTGALVTFNTVAVPVLLNSAGKLQVKVPLTANDGNFNIQLATGCSKVQAFDVVDTDLTACEVATGGAETPASDLIIYEVYDENGGSGGVITLYNRTGVLVNLSSYSIKRAGDYGGTYLTTANLSGTIAAGAVAVIGVTSSPCGYASTGNGSFGTGFNANDGFRLMKGTTIIDDVKAPNYLGYYLKRKNANLNPNTTFNGSEWTDQSLAVGECLTNVASQPVLKTAPLVTTNPTYNPICGLSGTSLTVVGTEGVVGGLPLAYQWYVLGTSGGWNAVSNGGIYSGAASASLSISSTSGLNGFQYYCQIRENSATCYSATTATTVLSEKIWDGTAWLGDGTLPTASEKIVFAGNYNSAVHGGSIEACACEVVGASSVVFKSEHYLKLKNELKVGSAASLLFENGSSLVQINPNAVNTGSISMARTTPDLFRYDFTYWSSPVIGFGLKQVSPITLFDKFFSWNAVGQSWNQHLSNLEPDNLEIMAPGRGYTVRAPQSYAVQGAGTAQPYTATFTGVPNNGTVTESVFGDGVLDKWNLVGNPYASAIDAAAFVSANTGILGGTLYFWTHNSSPVPNSNGQYYYIAADYVSWNNTGSTDACLSCLIAPSGKIGAGQSFFVKGVGAGAGTATFTNAMRLTGANNLFYKSATEENPVTAEKHRIWLNLQGATKGFNQTLIGYVDGATNGLDTQFDGDSFGGNEVTFYSVLDTKKLVIQGRVLPFTVQDSIPLGYKTTLTGNLTISIDHKDGLLENQVVYLKDNVLNVTHNLSTSNYVFVSTPGTYDSRFVLKYVPQENLDNPTFTDQIKGVTIRKNNADLHVSSPYELIDIVSVYDITGRLVFEKKQCNSNTFTTSHIVGNDQTLIVKVQLVNGGVVTGKVY